MAAFYSLLLLYSASTFCGASAPPAYYRTEPDHQTAHWDIRIITEDRSQLAPGYFFIAPQIWHNGMGPQIYDEDGHLVWDGGLTTTLGWPVVFSVCDWMGEKNDHICIHDARLELDPRLGNRVFDNTYTQVGFDYSNTGDIEGGYPDDHEFNMVPGGRTFLYPVIIMTPMDLRAYNSVEEGLVMNSCFQEADAETGEPFFTWRSLDYLEVWETYIFPNVPDHVNLTSRIAGDGGYEQPWDYIHLNSIDKNPEGDYLVSARHLDTILKIAGPNNVHGVEPGTILWRLGGKKSDFSFNFTFSRQHEARYISSGSSGDVISFFDNAWEGWDDNPSSADFSSGMIVSVNNITKEVELLHRYPHPEGKLSGSRGGFSVLPNNNTLAGWGQPIPEITEYSLNGLVLYHASFTYSDASLIAAGIETDLTPYSYRVQKYPWVGKPFWNPKVIAFAKTCTSTAYAYASWNGATEVTSWKFYTSTAMSGEWTLHKELYRDGFETMAPLDAEGDKWLPYVRVEAIDENGEVLARADAHVYVPDPTVIDDCDDFGCGPGFRYDLHDNAEVCACLEATRPMALVKSYLWAILPSAFGLVVLGAVGAEIIRGLFWRRARPRYAGPSSQGVGVGRPQMKKRRLQNGGLRDPEAAAGGGGAEFDDSGSQISLDEIHDTDSLLGRSSTSRE